MVSHELTFQTIFAFRRFPISFTASYSQPTALPVLGSTKFNGMKSLPVTARTDPALQIGQRLCLPEGGNGDENGESRYQYPFHDSSFVGSRYRKHSVSGKVAAENALNVPSCVGHGPRRAGEISPGEKGRTRRIVVS